MPWAISTWSIGQTMRGGTWKEDGTYNTHPAGFLSSGCSGRNRSAKSLFTGLCRIVVILVVPQFEFSCADFRRFLPLMGSPFQMITRQALFGSLNEKLRPAEN